ncbi:hypothetical protein ABZT17_20285 [Streptomyces sp. NPDC005648]|uniref:hypothetical protein n=1 Tax=Streptomyces sp. NPDC005648 TaxID=3157044 RepID=UPI0033BB0669
MTRKALVPAGLGAAALAATVLLAAPALAATTTGHSQFDVYFPGQKPATSYYVDNIATQKDGTIAGRSRLSWQILDDQAIDLSKRFTSFKITSRIEERLTKDGTDNVYSSKTCDLTKLVNDNYTWFQDEPVNNCAAPSALYDGEVFWSSDSTIVYDIEGDGKGAITQELQGSPLIHG